MFEETLEQSSEATMSGSNNISLPHVALRYCTDRPYLDLNLGGANFVYGRIALDIILTVSLITANSTLIVAIFRYRRRYRGTISVYNSGPSMKFVQVLAFSDVLVGLATPVYLVPHYFCDINDLMRDNMYLCMTKYVLTTFAAVMSNMSLLSIAVDRYLAVEFTLRYKMIMTHRVCHLIIAGQIVFAVVTSGVLFFWNHWEPGSFCDLEDVVPSVYLVVLGCVCHIAILVTVVGVHVKMHNKAAESASRRSIIMEGQISRWVPNHFKSARVVIMVTGVYFICWTPYSVCLLYRVLKNDPSRTFDLVFQTLFPFSYMNSLINPFIYAWKNTEIKNAIKWSIMRRTSTTSESTSC